jgi:hypothetical protein
MEFMRDALCGRKRLITNRDLAPVNVPRYKEFNASNLYKAAIVDDELKLYLPDPSTKESSKVINRRFLFNVSFPMQTCLGHQYSETGFFLAGNPEGTNRKEVEAGVGFESFHRNESGHAHSHYQLAPHLDR